jgi:WD40 repeat protein
VITTIAFSPDGKTLASGGDRGSIKLWDVASGEELMSLEDHSGPICLIRFSHDNKTLATCANRPDGSSEIFLWRATEDDALSAGGPDRMRLP